MVKQPKYYLNSSFSLGWGRDSVPDKERLQLIGRFTRGKSVLDVGCGYGLYVDYASSLGFNATGVDFVDEFIESAKKSKKGNFIKGKAEKLPFKNNEFDTVFLFDILEHGDDVKILQEAKRVCNKRILAIVPKNVDFALEQTGVIFRHYIDKSHLREYKEGDIGHLAKKAGLRVVHLRKIHPLYNETIFLALFKGPVFLKKLLRKIIFLILPKVDYPTEYFAVFEK